MRKRSDVTEPETVPSVASEVARLRSTDIAVPNFLKTAAEEGSGIHALILALKSGYDAADAVMARLGWTAATCPNTDTSNWHRDCSLMYYSCWGNTKERYNGESLLLYDYLVNRWPEAVHGPVPTGGNMLHAWMYNTQHLCILKDLLSRGVNPTQTDRDGKTPLDRLDDALTKLQSETAPSLDEIGAILEEKLRQMKERKVPGALIQQQRKGYTELKERLFDTGYNDKVIRDLQHARVILMEGIRRWHEEHTGSPASQASAGTGTFVQPSAGTVICTDRL
jgi:hypothetical protein